MADDIQVGSWNLRGLGEISQAQQLRKWIRKNKHQDTIMCLQELKLSSTQAEFKLSTVHQVIDKGFRGDGTFAWATISTRYGDISTGSIYAPNKRRDRIDLWRWILQLNPNKTWIFGGDLIWWNSGTMLWETAP